MGVLSTAAITRHPGTRRRRTAPRFGRALRPTALREGEGKALGRSFQRAGGVLLAVAGLGGIAAGRGAWPAHQLTSCATRRCDSSQGGRAPAPHAACFSRSLRATNQGSWSPPPRTGWPDGAAPAPFPSRRQCPGPGAGPGVEAQAHMLAQLAPPVVQDGAGCVADVAVQKFAETAARQ